MREKEIIRKESLAQRSKLPLDKVTRWSKEITDKFMSLTTVKQAHQIMSYVSFRNEVKTFPLLKMLLEGGYKIYVPYTIKNGPALGLGLINNLERDLEPGVFGVLEPRKEVRLKKIPSDLDLIIVPGAIFSKNGCRIGYGGGFYDSFLTKQGKDVLKVGFTFSQFVVEKLPSEEHDVPVDLIITEKDIIDCRNEVE